MANILIFLISIFDILYPFRKNFVVFRHVRSVIYVRFKIVLIKYEMLLDFVETIFKLKYEVKSREPRGLMLISVL